MPRHQLVERINEASRVQCPQRAANQVGQTERGEQLDAASAVARDERAVAKDEPPTFGPFFLGYGSQQAVSLLIGEGE